MAQVLLVNDARIGVGPVHTWARLGSGVDEMYIERTACGQILAAFLDEQFPGQEWLPIASRILQQFLANLPRLGAATREPNAALTGELA